MSMRLGFPPIGEVYFAMCKSIDSPVSLGAWLRFKYSHLELARMEINPRDYLDSRSFRDDYLVVSYLSKYKGLNTGLDLEAEAMRKFTSSEDQCRNTNARFKHGRNFGFSKPIEKVLHLVRRKIASVLGPYSVFAIEPGFGWGPGATSDIRRRAAFVDTKMCELPLSVSRRALPLAVSVLRQDLHWSSVILGVSVNDLSGPFSFLPSVFSFTEECVVDLVPKSAKTHRVIAKESRLNAFLQKGFGSYIRRRLKNEGIDLDDQGPNQRGAYFALADGLATLDLRAASDSMSLEVVYDLLPIDWAVALDDVRSRRARLPDGSVITLEKFSSMGNGFTFELETLIFYCLSWAVRSYMSIEGPLLVYGDDIICSKKMSHFLVNMLGFIGFSVNPEKSFVDGQFYESCGRHYFGGDDVTPVYQKEVVEDISGDMRMANRLLRVSSRLRDPGHDFHRGLASAWRVVRRGAYERGDLRSFCLPFGADGDEGYLLLADDWPSNIPWDINMGFLCPVLQQASRVLPAHDGALLAHVLRQGVSLQVPFGRAAVLAPVQRPRKGSRWVMPTGEFGLEI